ncbi:MAG TPA: hypothetical protein PLV83_06045, partial [Bacilli bacterium]|nr:hypothetical protein [Bacilli bacterium]
EIMKELKEKNMIKMEIGKYDDDLLSNSECEKEYFETVLNKFEGNALTVFLDNDDKGNAEIYELNDDFKKVYVEKVLCNEESIINIINTSKIGSNNFFANELKVCMDITHNLAKLDDEIIKRSKKL